MATPFALLNFKLSDSPNLDGRLYTDFEKVISTDKVTEILDCIAEIESWTAAGYHAVGYLTYEAAPAFDTALATNAPTPGQSLLWFGICREPRILEEDENGEVRFYDDQFSFDFRRYRRRDGGQKGSIRGMGSGYQISEALPLISKKQYTSAFTEIMDRISNGETYQINFTFPLESHFSGEVFGFYQDLRSAQSANYSAWIHTGEDDVLSVSPELFFEICGDTIRTRPMKGTRPRGRNVEEDEKICRELMASPKDNSENVMIVDLLRNDFGRIAQTGTVHVTSLFNAELYPTVIQMTSEVQARLQANISIIDVFKALFPPGSVTGAPKVKTMEIIAACEKVPRGVYCGAVGFLLPGGGASFNVPIRTLTIDAAGCTKYHVGSGLVADSSGEEEYDECLLKAGLFAHLQYRKLQLIETMLFEPATGIALLDRHITRLTTSARYFGFTCDSSAMRKGLSVKSTQWRTPQKIRLLLSRNGSCVIEASEFKQKKNTISKVRLAMSPVNSRDPFLYHKTTNRKAYDESSTNLGGVDDIIFYNDCGEITESSIANIMIEQNGDWITPPIQCGLLPGTMRAELLAAGSIKEGIITIESLYQATRVRLMNSVRGQYDVQLEAHPASVSCT